MAAVEAFAIAGDQAMLKRVLESETDHELRMAAIQGIAIHGGDDAVELIESMYAQAATKEEKLIILESLAILDGASNLALQVARTEADTQLRQMAIQILGVMGATVDLTGLYESVDELETRKMVLEAMMIAGDTTNLMKALETEQDPELKVTAIHAIAIGNDEGTADFLAGLYAGGSREEKVAVIESMMILDDASGLISLIRQEEDPGLRREMMEMLTVMDSEEADEFLFEMLENKS